MRMTRLHAPTLKEVPKDAEVVSHQLLVRAGYIRKLAAGVYDYLPLAMRVLRKIKGIIYEEHDRIGAQEVLLPMVQPAEIWVESGRWGHYGPELLRMKDRKGGEFCLGPTHEEVMTELVRRDVRSWRALPLCLYQIQDKFRDEVRPRAGLMRGREFIMKDAYSFDVDEAGAFKNYDAFYEAYERIFSRCGLNFRAVEADTGAIGGSRSHEFQVLADSGEDAIVACDKCHYAANVEQASLRVEEHEAGPASEACTKVSTPNARTIEEISAFLKLPAEQFIKTLIVQATANDGSKSLYAALVRGDHELNLVKLRKVIGASEVDLADEADVVRATNAPVGFAGPVNLTGVAGIYADLALRGCRDFATGANEGDAHFIHVDEGRDFTANFADLRIAVEGDSCPHCDGKLQVFKGIEVGQVFYLGTKYSKPMGCTYLDEAGEEKPMVMGCYGIGVTRTMAAAIEQHHDEDGIAWPVAIAPFDVTVLPLQMNKDDVIAAAEKLTADLEAAGLDVLLDDRNERAGSKFKDADLIGCPVQLIIGGRALAAGELEVKIRATGEKRMIPLDSVVESIRKILDERRALESQR